VFSYCPLLNIVQGFTLTSLGPWDVQRARVHSTAIPQSSYFEACEYNTEQHRIPRWGDGFTKWPVLTAGLMGRADIHAVAVYSWVEVPGRLSWLVDTDGNDHMHENSLIHICTYIHICYTIHVYI
jgi:hypothetical protein